VSSETRKPQLYSVSKIVLFRSPCGSLKSIEFISKSISSIDSVSGSFLPILGASIKFVGLTFL